MVELVAPPDPFLVPRRARESEKVTEYATRRVYLTHESPYPYNGPIPDPSCRSLKPPGQLFMTRNQARNDAALDVDRTATIMQATNRLNETSRAVRRPRGSGTLRLQAGVRKCSLLNKQAHEQAHHEEELIKGEWKLVFQAGVRFWVNGMTNEATDICPHPDLLKTNKQGAIDSTSMSTTQSLELCSPDNGWGTATGSLVYDPSEFAEVMRVLAK